VARLLRVLPVTAWDCVPQLCVCLCLFAVFCMRTVFILPFFFPSSDDVTYLSSSHRLLTCSAYPIVAKGAAAQLVFAFGPPHVYTHGGTTTTKRPSAFTTLPRLELSTVLPSLMQRCCRNSFLLPPLSQVRKGKNFRVDTSKFCCFIARGVRRLHASFLFYSPLFELKAWGNDLKCVTLSLSLSCASFSLALVPFFF
jgi:hypothetical protein